MGYGTPSILISNPTANTILEVSLNIVYSPDIGIQTNDNTYNNFSFTYNDFYGSSSPYDSIPNQAIQEGNVSVDPSFGDDITHCLSADSPVLHIAFQDWYTYMGYKGLCGVVTTPTPYPGPSSPIYPTAQPTGTPTAFATATTVGTSIPSPTATSSPQPVAGDVNGDGSVNIVDIGIVVDHYGESVDPYQNGDLNGDGIVNIVDLGIVISNY